MPIQYVQVEGLIHNIRQSSISMLITFIDNITGFTVLQYASMHNLRHLAKKLLNAGAEVDKTDLRGATALMYATGWRKTETVKVLLLANANPNITDEDGTSPLMLAVQSRHILIVSMLLASGADPRPSNISGYTAIDFAEDTPQIKEKLILASHIFDSKKPNDPSIRFDISI